MTTKYQVREKIDWRQFPIATEHFISCEGCCKSNQAHKRQIISVSCHHFPGNRRIMLCVRNILDTVIHCIVISFISIPSTIAWFIPFLSFSILLVLTIAKLVINTHYNIILANIWTVLASLSQHSAEFNINIWWWWIFMACEVLGFSLSYVSSLFIGCISNLQRNS